MGIGNSIPVHVAVRAAESITLLAPAAGPHRLGVLTVGNAVTVDIAVLTVRDTIAIQISIRGHRGIARPAAKLVIIRPIRYPVAIGITVQGVGNTITIHVVVLRIGDPVTIQVAARAVAFILLCAGERRVAAAAINAGIIKAHHVDMTFGQCR